MKTIYIKSIALLLIFSIISCSDVLDKDPLGILDAGSFFKTADDAEQALNAAYRPLLFANDNNNFLWVFSTVSSEIAIAGGDGSRAGIVEIDFLEHTPRTPELNDYWKLIYGGIIQCNTVITRTPDIDADDEIKNRIIGEALFLRAYYHFSLTQVFGSVPLIIKVQPPDEVLVPRDPLENIYAQIIKDCEDASQLLPTSFSGSNLGRATKGAALGLMAKTKLYQKDWDGVLETINDIKLLGIYSLMPEYLDNFTVDAQNNAESVWEIQHANLELGVGNNLNQWWTSKKIVDGYGFAEATQEFVDAFEPGDPRRAFTVTIKNEEYFGVTYKSSFSSTGFGIRKYLQSVEEVTQKSDGGINYTAIRYAEVLLWEAEALAELNRISEAQTPLEEVRARARALAEDPESTLPVVTTLDKTEMIDAVRNERLVELGYEMHRFFDLVRWGIADQVLDGFVIGKHEVFPIPQTEMDLNPMLVQSPGY